MSVDNSPLIEQPGDSDHLDITRTRPDLRGALEAVLFVADVPASVADLSVAVGAGPAEVLAALSELAAEYPRGSRGIDLRQVAGGWRLFTSDRFAEVVERYVVEGQQARLTQAALETLAVVAYRQPITRARVAAIRGVGVDGVFRTLAARGLVEECGSDAGGGAHLYRTTALFLEKFGLDDLSELPSLAPLLPEASELEDVSPSA
jgi:segregation and condensation protein B